MKSWITFIVKWKLYLEKMGHILMGYIFARIIHIKVMKVRYLN